MKVILDERNMNESVEKTHFNVDESEARLLLEKLNGREHTLISFYRADESVLMIGGGPDFYIINLASTDSHYYSLKNIENNSSGFIEICAGGQYADFTKDIVVSKSMADLAVKMFYMNEERSLEWIED